MSSLAGSRTVPDEFIRCKAFISTKESPVPLAKHVIACCIRATMSAGTSCLSDPLEWGTSFSARGNRFHSLLQHCIPIEYGVRMTIPRRAYREILDQRGRVSINCRLAVACLAPEDDGHRERRNGLRLMRWRQRRDMRRRPRPSSERVRAKRHSVKPDRRRWSAREARRPRRGAALGRHSQ